MFKRINSNKNGVIEYSIDSIEDLDKLPRKETDNTVYATLNKNGKRLIYLYSKAAKDYILINGDLEEINKEINNINEQLDNKANENEVRKNNVLIDTKDITDNLRQQITGNAPIMATLEDKAVTPIKTNFFDIEVDYTNILNIASSVKGLLDSTTTGELVANESFSTVKFIPVTENTNYIFSINNVSVVNLSALCFYKSDKSFISGTTNVNTFTTPSECAFISISIYGLFDEMSQIEKGSTCTPYVPYKNIIKNDGIKEEVMPKILRRIEPLEKQISQIFEFKTINLTIKKGFYDGNTFYDNLSYDTVEIPCEEGDIFRITGFVLGATQMPLARFCNSNMEVISNSGAITVDTTFRDFEIVIPANTSFITVTSRNDNGIDLMVKKNTLVVKTVQKKVTDGLKFIAIGDSITAEFTRWREQFIRKTGAIELMCTAVPGAHLADYSDTVLDGTNFEEHGNTVCNQIQKIINNTPSDIPDFIIISAITNDTLSYEQLVESADIDVFIGSSYPNYIDIDTVDRTTIDGAMRWQVEKLYELFPNVKIFFASPIQAYEGIRATWNIIMKEQKLIRVANKMGIKVIKAGSESGIYGRYENNGTNGKYLADGLHPNIEGGKVLGNYYASQIINYFSYI